MFAFDSFNAAHKLAGPGYIILNVIRVLNIIVLLLIAIASWVMLVMTFFFFDGVSHFITSLISLFLIVSELSLFPDYFLRYWPLLGLESGLVFLGSAMVVLGFNTMGNLNKTATSIENLGLPLWRLVLASGILATIMGVANIVATIVLCDSAQGITGRQVRSRGATAMNEKLEPSLSRNYSRNSFRPGTRTSDLPSYNTQDRRRSKFGFKFPIRIAGLSRPTANEPEQSKWASRFSRAPVEISGPIPTDNDQFSKWESRTSPVAPEIERPPTALHPAYSPASRYSERNYEMTGPFEYGVWESGVNFFYTRHYDGDDVGDGNRGRRRES
ncbi:hypothetical protein BP5796_02619 [Coleophoma crateriformis]|uniref:DUF7598 domain-containing protein n=1 Tax=Coleophoma crateriformis TaxID=565419 RepID=A0A3D8SYT3_9HELO|nr:hypothetical protein BP5796_02619 [Coleophoma crateriformis]